MKKSSIYTKTGDKGETALVSGNRLSKGHEKIDLYGEVDELNSFLGVGICLLKNEKDTFGEQLIVLDRIQHLLFDLGSNLACEDENRLKYKLPKISASEVENLEKNMDLMDSELTPLKNFVLPGGTLVSAQFHVCRTVTRRVERKLVTSLENEEAPMNSIVFVNRLSDYFFILSRYVNHKLGKAEHIWKPAK